MAALWLHFLYTETKKAGDLVSWEPRTSVGRLLHTKPSQITRDYSAQGHGVIAQVI